MPRLHDKDDRLCKRDERRILATRSQDRTAPLERSWTMAAQVTLAEPELRAFSSLPSRVSDRPATYEEQTHQDERHAEELWAPADDLLGRLDHTEPDRPGRGFARVPVGANRNR
jgi:hypothetical protein